MLNYRLHKTDGNLIFYLYYPNGSANAGTVYINKETGETSVVTPSKDDLGDRFAFKLIKRLKEFYKENVYKEEGTIAWY